MLLRLGTRGSRLALAQAELTADAIRVAQPSLGIALVPISTAGDLDRRKPFAEIGERGIFVKELEDALLAGRVDIAVHSAKDLTTTDPAGTTVGAYLPRDDPRDALCGVTSLEPGMRIGTASARRKALLLALQPELVIEPLRGNVDTRLRKRRERGLDAVVLAACGLDRLGLEAEIGLRIDADQVLPEAGQGAIALQIREGSERELMAALDHAPTRTRVEAERACVARIGAGCSAPVAAHHDGVALAAAIAADDGSWVERRSGDDPARLADELLAAVP
ncbi:MAG: hydroxymethylbilane synthase [Gaiellaceae bacterium]